MRTCTLTLSIAVHLMAVAAIIVSPIVASDVLPEPRRAFEYITVLPPPLPPPAPPIGTPSKTPSNPAAAPVDAPLGISRETGFERATDDVGEERGVPDGIPGGMDASILPSDAPPPPPPTPPAGPVRVGGLIKYPQKVREVPPVYPAIAQSARVQSMVILEAVLGEDGRVRNLRVLRSIPLLDQAAIEAVRQWQFTPTLLNGQPVPVVFTVTVDFRLK